MLENIIPAAIVILVVGAASLYVYRAKKSGKKCIGCPDGGGCDGHCGGCGSCHSGS